MSIKNLILGREVIVPVGTQALVYDDGAVSGVLGPGRHRVPAQRTLIQVRVAERVLPVAMQEITTAESVAVRVSLALRVRVTDPVAYAERAVDPDALVYLAAQIALREVLSGAAIEDLLGRGEAVDYAPITVAAARAGEAVGVEVLDVFVKDIVLPHEVRGAAIELVTAKTRGAARLEAARAETAALRALANAGRMLDASPALARLRMIQEVPYGAKVVFGVVDPAD